MVDLRRGYLSIDSLKQFYTSFKVREIFITIIFCLLLFFVSMVIKNNISILLNQRYSGFYWQGKNLKGEDVTWYVEAYVDAWYYYEPYLRSFKYQNWNPYAGGEGPLNGYAYGPLFIYGLYFTSLFIQLFNPNMALDVLLFESIKWTHILFDSLCVSVVYLIVINFDCLKYKKVVKHTTGLIASVLYIFMPFNIIYVNTLYLNIPQMTFFTLLAYLAFLKSKYRVSALFLTFAWLSKQMPLFLVIGWFMIIWKKESLKEAFVKFLVPFILTTLVFSIPWVLLTPYAYLRKILGPGRPVGVLANSPEYNGFTVTLANSFLHLEAEGLAKVYFNMNKYMVPFILSYLFILFMGYFNGKEIGHNEKISTIYTTLIVLVTHVFISRGIYKYYDAFISPFVLLSIIRLLNDSLAGILKRNEEKSSQVTLKVMYALIYSLFLLISTIGFYCYSWIIIIKPRYVHPLYLLLLFVLFLLFVPSKMYASFKKKSKWKMIIDDLDYIFTSICQFIKNKI